MEKVCLQQDKFANIEVERKQDRELRENSFLTLSYHVNAFCFNVIYKLMLLSEYSEYMPMHHI